MTDRLKQFLLQKNILDLIDDGNYTEVYKLCDRQNKADLTKFLLLCDVKPDEYMTTLPDYYLRKSDVQSYHISPTIDVIGECAFYMCQELESITIPDSVTYIAECAFWGCSSLTNIVIPDSVTSIGDWAFSDCRSLTSITIPDSVTSIGNGAFSVCTSLKSIHFSGTVAEWNAISKCSGWNNSFGAERTVYCTDGIL